MNYTHTYIATCKCGAILAAIADCEEVKEDMIEAVIGWIKEGYVVSRVKADAFTFGTCSCLFTNVSKHKGIDHELRVMPQINGFKVKYRGNIYDDFEIKRNDVIILNPTGNRIQTSPNKCEIIIDYAA